MERRLVFTEKQKVALEDYKPPEVKAGEVAIRVRRSLMSTGTECIVFNRWFEAGTGWDNWVKYPFYPGYSSTGEVVETGPGVTGVRKGDRVVTRCGHGSYHVISAANCVVVPKAVSDEAAVWFALAKITAMGMRAADYRCGSNVCIIGAGPIGQMSVRWAAAAGVENLIVVDSVPLRLEFARKGGATATIDKPIDAALPDIERYNGGRKPEIVIDTTGNAAVFVAALAAADKFGTVVILGDTGTPSQQHLSHDVINKGLRIIGAHDCHETAGWDTPRIGRLFFTLVADGRMRMDGLNTHTFRPETATAAYDLATKRRQETMGIVFDWNAA